MVSVVFEEDVLCVWQVRSAEGDLRRDWDRTEETGTEKIETLLAWGRRGGR